MSQNTLKVHDLNEDAEFDENGVEAFDEKALSEEEPSDNDLAEEELLSQGATQRVLDATQLYLGEIGYSPLLTAEEEVYFARRALRGDVASRRRMIESNIRIIKRNIGFRCPFLMILSCMALQELVQIGIPTIKIHSIVGFPYRGLMPVCKHHFFMSGRAKAAARSFSFGAGGLSKISMIILVSRSVRYTRSAASTIFCATGSMLLTTKSVRLVCWIAAARTINFLASVDTRNDSLSLDSIAI